MPDPSIIDNWLDLWDELHEQGQTISLKQFVEQHCQGASPILINEFRVRVAALSSMNRHVQKAKGHALSTGDQRALDTAGGATGHLDLQPGMEPVPGYRLTKWLGRGGFGEVWQATAPGGLPVALNFVLLSPHRTRTELRALDIIKRVRHPHLLAPRHRT